MCHHQPNAVLDTKQPIFYFQQTQSGGDYSPLMVDVLYSRHIICPNHQTLCPNLEQPVPQHQNHHSHLKGIDMVRLFQFHCQVLKVGPHQQHCSANFIWQLQMGPPDSQLDATVDSLKQTVELYSPLPQQTHLKAPYMKPNDWGQSQ